MGLGAQQVVYSISKDKTPSLSITGASTMHDWTVTVEEWSGYPNQIIFENADEMTIAGYSFVAQTASIDGGRGSAMNKKIYTALNSRTYPQITFNQVGEVSLSKAADPDFRREVSGILTMLGQEHEIAVTVQMNIDGGTLTLSADHDMKLSDYGIKPPTAMFGQIKTKDDISIHFECHYQLTTN